MSLSQRDRKNIWHPYEPFAAPLPIPIVSAHGSRLVTEDGRELIDAISSWWVNIHGHAHPKITKAIHNQLEKMHHVIFAGFTHEPAVALAENLLLKLPRNQSKIFYSDNGSTAVEVALKICFQFWSNNGETRTSVIALEDGYHGDTFGAMSVSSRGIFVKPFSELLFDVEHIPSPADEPERTLESLEKLLKTKNPACFIFEPLVQGAGGMKMYSPETLKAMVSLCKRYQVPCIADEVMTGFGRTGSFFATDQIKDPIAINDNFSPDIFCLSKGLTGGTLPMGVTSCSSELYDAFASTDFYKTLFHGHSYTANPLACAAANASFELMSEDETWHNIKRITKSHDVFSASLQEISNVKNIRHSGTILAFDVVTAGNSSYSNPVKQKIHDFCLEQDVFLRPLGEVVYVLPPYCTTDDELKKIYRAILSMLNNV